MRNRFLVITLVGENLRKRQLGSRIIGLELQHALEILGGFAGLPVEPQLRVSTQDMRQPIVWEAVDPGGCESNGVDQPIRRHEAGNQSFENNELLRRLTVQKFEEGI